MGEGTIEELTILCILLFIMIVVFIVLVCNYSVIDEKLSYKGDVKVIHTSEKCIFEIYIEDSFLDNGEKYFILKTDKTKNKEFTLSEKNYDSYIGKDKHLIEGYIYELKLESNMNDEITWIKDKENINITSQAIMHRYSIFGERDFTEKEIKEYIKMFKNQKKLYNL